MTAKQKITCLELIEIANQDLSACMGPGIRSLADLQEHQMDSYLKQYEIIDPENVELTKEKSDIRLLVNAITKQTQAMEALVESNAKIIQCFIEALREEEGDEDKEPDNYLDGTPL